MKVGKRMSVRGRKSKYDWSEIFAQMGKVKDDQMVIFSQGDDYSCSAHSFRAMLHTAAKQRGLLLDVVVLDSGKTVGSRVSDRAPRVLRSKNAQEKKTVKASATPVSEQGKRKTTRSK